MRSASQLVLLIPLVLTAACGEPTPTDLATVESSATEAASPAPTPTPAVASTPLDQPWLDFTGTSVVGFGVLRLVCEPGDEASYRIVYRDTPADGYSITDNAQLFVLPGDAFARQEMAYAHQFLAFGRTYPYENGYVPDPLEIVVELTIREETTVIVAYGPWTGPDTGRPPGDDPTFSLRVDDMTEGAAHEWLESEAGELITTNWTPRPEVERGQPIVDPISKQNVWLEVRPLILYDAALARSSEEPPAPDLGNAPPPEVLRAQADAWEAQGRTALAVDARERADDLVAVARRKDTRIVLTPELTERFRRVPIRWR